MQCILVLVSVGSSNEKAKSVALFIRSTRRQAHIHMHTHVHIRIHMHTYIYCLQLSLCYWLCTLAESYQKFPNLIFTGQWNWVIETLTLLASVYTFSYAGYSYSCLPKVKRVFVSLTWPQHLLCLKGYLTDVDKFLTDSFICFICPLVSLPACPSVHMSASMCSAIKVLCLFIEFGPLCLFI